MRQILCDDCGEIIDPQEVIGDAMPVVVKIYTCYDTDASAVKEFHRKCARNQTVASIWQRAGLVPL